LKNASKKKLNPFDFPQLGIGLHIETKPSGEQIIANVKPGYDAEAKGNTEFDLSHHLSLSLD
jgi:hypothetical protein